MEAGLSWGLQEKPPLLRLSKRQRKPARGCGRGLGAPFPGCSRFPAPSSARPALLRLQLAERSGSSGQPAVLPVLTCHFIINWSRKVEQGQPRCCLQELHLVRLNVS